MNSVINPDWHIAAARALGALKRTPTGYIAAARALSALKRTPTAYKKGRNPEWRVAALKNFLQKKKMQAVATSLRRYYPDQVHRDSSHINVHKHLYELHLSQFSAPSSDVFVKTGKGTWVFVF